MVLVISRDIFPYLFIGGFILLDFLGNYCLLVNDSLHFTCLVRSPLSVDISVPPTSGAIYVVTKQAIGIV